MGQVIIISENGKVSIPDNVKMMDFEVAQLFGVCIQTVKGKVKQILKEHICRGDFSDGGVVYGNMIMPEYYGLDMITAIAFRVESPKAKIFREWIIKRISEKRIIHQPSMFIHLPIRSILN